MRRSERIAAEIDLAVVGEQRAEDVFDVAGMFVLSVFVILIDLVVTLVERRLLVWRPTAAEGRG
jgi:NitT/TauT family transport system permease protein